VSGSGAEVPPQEGPSVSIVVPVYNRAGRLLDEALESLLLQDHPAIEVVAIDDGSTDRTPDALAAYAERHPERLRWANQANGGQGAALNHGFELATGELIGYLSSDDVLLPGAISALAAALERDPEAVLAYPRYRVIDDVGQTIDSVAPPPYSWIDSVRLQDTIVGPGALFRASALREAGPVRSDLRYLPDMELWLRLGKLGRFIRVDRELACWRRHSGSLSGGERGREMAEERLRLLDELITFHPKELASVGDEAYRNALVLAASVVTAGFNQAGGRYFVVDRHAREVSARSGRESSEERMVTARDRMRAQAARIDELERELGGRGPARGLLPARLRGWAGALRNRAGRGGRGSRGS